MLGLILRQEGVGKKMVSEIKIALKLVQAIELCAGSTATEVQGAAF